MRNTHKHFRKAIRSLAEKRLLAMSPPNYEDFMANYFVEVGGEKIELSRTQWEKWKNIEDILDLTVRRNGSPEVKKNWADPVVRNAILASVVLKEDGRYDILPQSAQDLAKAADKEYRNEVTKVETWKQILSNHVAKFRKSIKSAEESLGRDKDLDGGVKYPKHAELLKLVKEMKASIPDVESRMFTLVEVSRAIAKTRSDTEFKDLFAKLATAMDTVLVEQATPPPITLTKHLQNMVTGFAATDSISQRRVKMMAALEIAAKIPLPKDAEKTIAQALAETETALATVDADYKVQMEERLKAHTNALNRLGGNDVGGIIESSIQLDGKFSQDLLKTTLSILGVKDVDKLLPKILEIGGLDAAGTNLALDTANSKIMIDKYGAHGLDAAKIKALLKVLLLQGRAALEQQPDWKTVYGKAEAAAVLKNAALDKVVFKAEYADDFFEELLATWDREPLKRHLGTAQGLNLDTSHGSSFASLVMRARLPENVAQDLIEGKLADDMHVHTLVELSKIDDATELVRNTDLALGVPGKIVLTSFLTQKNAEGKTLITKAADITTLGAKLTARQSAIQALPAAKAAKVAQDAKVEQAKQAVQNAPNLVAKQVADAALVLEVNKAQVTDAALKNLQDIITDFTTFLDPFLDAQQMQFVQQFLAKQGGLTENGARKIARLMTEKDPSTGDIVLHSRKHALEVLTFLFLEKERGRQKIDVAEAARKKAEMAFDMLVASKVITKTGSTYKIAGQDSKNLTDVLQRFFVGEKAQRHIHDLRAAKINLVTMTGAASLYVGKLWEDVESGVGAWFERFKALPGTFWNPAGNAKLLEKLNQSRALDKYKDLLEGITSSQSEGRGLMRGVNEEVREFEEHINDIIEAKTPSSFKEQITQGMYLVNAASLATEHLRRGNTDFDHLPPRIRQLSIWIALHRGKNGLSEATQFLEGYYRAPKEYSFFVQAFDAYNANPNPGPADHARLLKALENYQTVSGLPAALFTSLRDALRKYQDALELPDSNPTEVTAKEAALTAARGPYQDAVKVYMAEAQKFESAQDDPFKTRNNYLRLYLVNLKPEDREKMDRFLQKLGMLEEIHGRNSLKRLHNAFQLAIRPLALLALAESKGNPVARGVQLPEANMSSGSYALDRWLVEGHRNFAREPLDIVLTGPPKNKQAFIDAYITGQDQTYTTIDTAGNVVVKTVTAKRAFEEVKEIKRLLEYHSNTQHESLKQARDKEFFTNPLDKGLRIGIETLQDLWAGDAVDKGKVIVAIVAGIWLLRHIWKKGGEDGNPLMKLAKFAMVGIPLLMIGNSMIKSHTGRDRLGEMFLYMSKEERNTALEQWRRRAVASGNPDYGVLNTTAGIVAIDELSNTKDPVDVEDLLKWRDKVRKRGYKNYADGAPPNLKVNSIMLELGAKGSKDEAYKIAFTAFDALCSDVAYLNGQSGAEWGADHIWNEYVDVQSYDGSDIPVGADAVMVERRRQLREALQGRKISILDVIISESRLRSPHAEDSEENLRFLENLAKRTGIAKDKLGAFLSRQWAGAEIAFHRTTEFAGDLWNTVEKNGPDAAAAAWDIMRVQGSIAWNVLSKDAKAAWDLLYNTLTGTGMYLVREGPDKVSWAIKGGASLGLGALQSIYSFVDRHPLLGGDLLRSLEGFLDREVGGTISDLIALKLKIPVDHERVKHLAERGAWYKRLKRAAVTTVSGFPTSGEVDTMLLAEAQTMGIPALNTATFDKLSPYQKMMVYEQVKKKINVKIIAAYLQELINRSGNTAGLTTVTVGDWDIANLNALELALEKSYGRRTIQFLNNEKTWTGELGVLAKRLQGSVISQKPTQVAEWLLDWFQRNDADEQLDTAARVHKDRFLYKARKVFAGVKDEDIIIEHYKGYLDTIFANVVVELALDTAGRNKATPPSINRPTTPLHLAIQDANDMLVALATLRSSSANPDRIHTDVPDSAKLIKQLKVFQTDGPLPAIASQISGVNLVAPAPTNPAAVTANAEAKTLLGANFDVNDAGERGKALGLLEKVSKTDLRDKLRTALVPYYNTQAKLDTLVVRRSGAASPERVQFLINSAAVLQLESMVATLSTVDISDFATATIRNTWQTKLLALYKAVKGGSHSTSDEVGDNISVFLEYVTYLDPSNKRIKRKGKLAAYEKYLTTNGAHSEYAPTTTRSYSSFVFLGGFDTAQIRFDKDELVPSPGLLTTGSFSGRISRCKSILDM